MLTINSPLTRIKIDFVLIAFEAVRPCKNVLGLNATRGIPEWRLVGLTEICVGVRVHVTLVLQVQVMAAAKGRAVADAAIDSVTMVTVCVWFKRSVEVIFEWEQKGLCAGNVVSTWNKGDCWNQRASHAQNITWHILQATEEMGDSAASPIITVRYKEQIRHGVILGPLYPQ